MNSCTLNFQPQSTSQMPMWFQCSDYLTDVANSSLVTRNHYFVIVYFCSQSATKLHVCNLTTKMQPHQHNTTLLNVDSLFSEKKMFFLIDLNKKHKTHKSCKMYKGVFFFWVYDLMTIPSYFCPIYSFCCIFLMYNSWQCCLILDNNALGTHNQSTKDSYKDNTSPEVSSPLRL